MNTEYEHKKSKQKGGFLHAPDNSYTTYSVFTGAQKNLRHISILRVLFYMVPTQEATIHRILI